MDAAKQQIVESIRGHSNILITVSTDPSVDELSAALGLTILLNNIDKRATAIMSGAIPPAITFLEPDKTFESTADSLRDFIIALDKEKADHLRYKVEGDAVKIFITPYRTTLSEKDLEFSQGDYNVELVIALGVKDQDHLDKGLTAHGKILHDATMATITVGGQKSSLGSIAWHDEAAGSLSEMVVSLADALKTDKSLLDQQVATAFLTGIVSATDRFSNDRTSSQVMTMAAQLMAAGANQQLIAAKLEEAHAIGPQAPGAQKPVEQSTEVQNEESGDTATELTIDRSDSKNKTDEAVFEQPQKEKVIEPLATAMQSAPVLEEQPAQSQEVQDQMELEKQLAGLSSPAPVVPDAPGESNESGESLEDLEKDLKAATAELSQEAPKFEPESTAETPQVQISDATLPAFEPTPLPSLPAFETPQLDESPSIINEHGSRTDGVLDTSPINGIQDGSSGDMPSVNPFGTQPTVGTVPDLAPPSSVGTLEGAALLAGDPVAPPPQAPPTMAPQLPPLPPLPANADFPPLPPPPPLPPMNTVAPMPAGVPTFDQSGGAFGGAPPIPTPSAPIAAPAAPEPGQFRIPGQ